MRNSTGAASAKWSNELLSLFTQALQTYTLPFREENSIERPLSFNSINKRKSVRKMPQDAAERTLEMFCCTPKSHSHSLEIYLTYFLLLIWVVQRRLMPLNCRKLPCHSGQNGQSNFAWINVISKYCNAKVSIHCQNIVSQNMKKGPRCQGWQHRWEGSKQLSLIVQLFYWGGLLARIYLDDLESLLLSAV